MKSIALTALFGVVGAAALGWLLLLPVSRPMAPSKLTQVLGRMHGIGTRLRRYAHDHASVPGGWSTNTSIEALVKEGILSQEDRRFLRDHDVKYHGFAPALVEEHIPVLEITLAGPKLQRRIVSYSDGGVSVTDAQVTP